MYYSHFVQDFTENVSWIFNRTENLIVIQKLLFNKNVLEVGCERLSIVTADKLWNLPSSQLLIFVYGGQLSQM